MITFFPTAYKDEILYSLISRYHIRSSNCSYVDTINDLYGKGNIQSIIDMPTNNEVLLRNIPYKFDNDYFITKFTLINYYTAFLNKLTRNNMIKELLQEGGKGINSKVAASQISCKYDGYIKLCPICYREEVETLGEGYLHRINQIPEVLVCLKHKIPLLRSVEPFHLYRNKFIELSSVAFVNLEDKEIIERNKEKFLLIVQDIQYLLNNEICNREMVWFSEQFKNRLRQLNLCTPKGVVNINKVKKDFRDFYGAELLSIFTLNTFSDDSENWIKYLIRNNKYVLNPIKYILFCRFLGINIDSLFSNKIEYKPFGDPKWICKNKICRYYNKQVIEEVSVSYNSHKKKPTGRFKCKECGLEYSIVGPFEHNDDINMEGKVLSIGWLFKERLRSLLNQNLSLNTIEKELQTTQKTIKKYAEQMGYTQYLKDRIKDKGTIGLNRTRQELKKNRKKEKIQNYRLEWKDILNNNSNENITFLRNNYAKVYDYLYREDKKWLYQNRPAISKKETGISQVNWALKDKLILEEVINAVNIINHLENKPKKITLTYVSKMVNRKTFIYNNIDRLPLTKDYIFKIINKESK